MVFCKSWKFCSNDPISIRFRNRFCSAAFDSTSPLELEMAAESEAEGVWSLVDSSVSTHRTSLQISLESSSSVLVAYRVRLDDVGELPLSCCLTLDDSDAKYSSSPVLPSCPS